MHETETERMNNWARKRKLNRKKAKGNKRGRRQTDQQCMAKTQGWVVALAPCSCPITLSPLQVKWLFSTVVQLKQASGSDYKNVIQRVV